MRHLVNEHKDIDTSTFVPKVTPPRSRPRSRPAKIVKEELPAAAADNAAKVEVIDEDYTPPVKVAKQDTPDSKKGNINSKHLQYSLLSFSTFIFTLTKW